jgi:biopolymer transport protein ExbD
MKIKGIDERNRNRYAINITPLIDVIFLLMIFFLMTMNLNKPEGMLFNRLPQSSSQDAAEAPKDWETVRLKIQMIRENKVMKIHLQERVVYTYSDLLHYLDQLPEDIMIVIEPHKTVPYKQVVGVYNTCVKSKKKNVVFSVST